MDKKTKVLPKMNVDILISTIDSGIYGIYKMLLPNDDSIKYIISWQHSTEGSYSIPEELNRDDVSVYELNGKGLSRNRNNCILHATSDICLIADDDIIYNKDSIRKLIDFYKNHEDVDLVTYQFSSDCQTKKYPKEACKLSDRPNGFSISSIEISFRRKSIQGIIPFNELMGLGSPKTSAGEDDLFIFSCIKAGLNCWYIPLSLCYHKGKSTGQANGSDPRVIFSRGILIRVYHPYTFLLWYLWLARSIKINHGVNFWTCLILLLKSAIYTKHNRINHLI